MARFYRSRCMFRGAIRMDTGFEHWRGHHFSLLTSHFSSIWRSVPFRYRVAPGTEHPKSRVRGLHCHWICSRMCLWSCNVTSATVWNRKTIIPDRLGKAGRKRSGMIVLRRNQFTDNYSPVSPVAYFPFSCYIEAAKEKKHLSLKMQGRTESLPENRVRAKNFRSATYVRPAGCKLPNVLGIFAG